jgi:hypothetical protein
MNDEFVKIKNWLRYHLFSGLSFLISFVGLFGIKIISVIIGIAFALLTDNYLGNWGLLLGWIIGLTAGGLWYSIFQYLVPYIERLEQIGLRYKPTPFTDRFGDDYQKPTPDKYEITNEEFADYNNRFQFIIIRLVVVYGVYLVGLCLILTNKVTGANGYIAFGTSIIIAVSLDKLFAFLNKRISKKHPCYSKINEYQQAFEIFAKVRDENSKH